MANRIPLVVVSSEQLIKELPATDDLDLGNSSIQNANTVNATTLIGTTANLTTVNSTTLIGTTANLTTVNSTTLIGTTANLTTTNTESFVTSTAVISGITTLEEVLEKTIISATAMSANVNFDVLDGAVVYYTANASANCTLNVRGNTSLNLNSVMSSNQALTIVFAATNGATAYKISNVQIDGAEVTPMWSGGSAPTATANSIDAYSFTIIKTASETYTILGSKSDFG